jgi:glucose dehydrogenase
MRYYGTFTPPSTDLSLSYPGSLGGMNWGSAAVEDNKPIERPAELFNERSVVDGRVGFQS